MDMTHHIQHDTFPLFYDPVGTTAPGYSINKTQERVLQVSRHSIIRPVQRQLSKSGVYNRTNRSGVSTKYFEFLIEL